MNSEKYVDTTSGTINVRATFGNEEQRLWPGQFVNVTLTLDTLDNATVIPTEAIQASQMGQMIYVVKDGNVVEPRIVTVGQTFDRKSTIDKGVAPGETVVIDGQMRLFPGAKIRPVDPAKIEAGKL